jgi:hypothetical protein
VAAILAVVWFEDMKDAKDMIRIKASLHRYRQSQREPNGFSRWLSP